ncbi:hypothetical protein PT520_09565 [Aliarcobacter butzleri]|uniref:Uncharacterized protein n=1 Tax=Aliarcobacter butzleri TaxID=28197 RepID=A0AAW6VRD2_9BACT|nr:hypothetical protein [Aliarcobacter butzleri]MDK2062763.1 hypothetical protein [Aliarcobacter butzleri]
MENWLNINQKRSIEWNLTNAESLLCAFYAQEHPWVRTRLSDEDGDYLCIAITKLIKELPIIGKSKKNFSISLNSLTSKKIFDKIVDEDNQRSVFYRMNFLYKAYWKYPNLILASDIKTKNVCIANVSEMQQLLPNGNSMSILTQLFPNNLEVLPNGNEVLPNGNEVLPNGNLSNKQSNKQSNKHNQYMEDNDSFSKNNIKENLLRTEFDKLLEIYPQTVNNSPKTLALAFGSFSNLTQTQRVDLFKAVRNYAKTKQVKDHQKKATTNFIQSLNNFITKSFTEFVYGLPENYTFEEEFEIPQKPNGAQVEVLADFQVEINGVFVSAINELNKFKQAKRILEQDNFISNGAGNYDESKIKVLFSQKEWEKIQMRGGVASINQYEAQMLTETLIEDIAKENN